MTSGSSGFDLVSALGPNESIVIVPGGTWRVPTGLRFEIPSGYEGQIRPRSGLAAKHGVTVLNAPGTIDADYRGEVDVLLVNHGRATYIVQPGDRIAQIVFAAVSIPMMLGCDDLGETERSSGGFGSTG